MYHWFFRTVFVRTDPELAHHLAMGAIRIAGQIAPLRLALQATLGRKTRSLLKKDEALGVAFPGVLGLAAGMDKEGEAILGMSALGFSFVEIGTLTPRPQPGNERPRLWRIPSQLALRNRMGFNNSGSKAAGVRLRKLRQSEAGRKVVVGVNIGKNKTTALEDAHLDYAQAAKDVARWADYLVVNVSSPNTPNLRELQNVQALRPILAATRRAADEVSLKHVPLLVKIAPDLADEDINAVAALVEELDLAGVVATNTTINHNLGAGGLSGQPLTDRCLEVVTRLRANLSEQRIIMGVGGISTPKQGQAMLDAGANYLQGLTAFVYEGPAWPGRLNRTLGR